LVNVISVALVFGAALCAQDASWLEQPPSLWTLERRDAGFRHMEKIYKSATVPAGGKVHVFGAGKPIALSVDVDAYMKSQRAAGLLIVQDNKIRFEKYGLGQDASGRWTSMSVGKSVTSTLIGAALKDGRIRSLDDKVTTYIKGLKGSPYDDVTVRHLLTMTSGLKWNEAYTDPASDNVRLRFEPMQAGANATVSYMRRLVREVPAGTRWLYNSGDTELFGVLFREATGKSLSAYLSEKIWKPYGMEQSAYWDLTPSGVERSGGGLSVTLRDYARFGQFILDGAMIDGRSIVPPDWLAQATVKQADIGVPGRGYGYLWWTNDDGTFEARGIFGQSIFIDRKRRMVIATNGNWPVPTDYVTLAPARSAFWKSVQADIDAGK
jgi:CubicO group peptidase (beta-lactamase class C family)